jgi:single-strand DNA-binding protein
MSDVNHVILIGRLTRDAELKQAGGSSICKFALAVNRRVKHGDQWQDEASFFDCDYWGKGGEAVAKYLTKGKQVAIEGSLKQDRWQDSDGKARSAIRVNADNVQLLGGDKGGANGGDTFTDDIPY